MSDTFIQTSAPAVFVFDPATGDAVSLNSGAVRLIERFGLAAAPRLTLAAIERGVMVGAKTRNCPLAGQDHAVAASELRRECLLPDGSLLALSRVWAPGTSTMLVIEDLTLAMQDHRRQRIWNMMVAHMASTEDVATVLDKALRVFCLLSRSPGGEVWLAEDGVLIRRSARSSSRAVADGASAARKTSPDDSVVGQVWVKGKPVYAAHRVAIPMFAGTALVAVLALDASPACASDLLAFTLIESLAPLFGLALLTLRQGEELAAAAKTPRIEGKSIASSRPRRSAGRTKAAHAMSLRAAS